MSKKLTPSKVAKIKVDIVNGNLRQEAIAKKHGVTRGTISNISCGRSWTDVPWPDADNADDRIRALECDLQLLRDQNSVLRKDIKTHAREGGVIQHAVDTMSDYTSPFKPIDSVYQPSKKAIYREPAVLVLSDEHADQIVTAEETNGLEEYNFDVACARAETLVAKTINWTKSILQPSYDINDLFIFAIGDHTSGEIHGHEEVSYTGNIIHNVLLIGDLHALMLRDLSPHFESINVIYLSGNHGRFTPKKDQKHPLRNWDHMIAQIAKRRCEDIPNINIQTPNSYSANVIVNGVGCNLSHGDDIRASSGLPFYGLQRRQKNLIALNANQNTPPIKHIYTGHFHTCSTLSDLGGKLFVNGAWPATDAYAYNSFTGYREPEQILHGMSKDGVSWRADIRLKDGPSTSKRYRSKIK